MDYISIPVSSRRNKFISTLTYLFQNALSVSQEVAGSTGRKVRRLKFTKKNIGTYIFIGIVGIAIFFSTRFILRQVSAARNQTTSQTQQTTLTQTINREFSFIVYDKNKELTDSIRYIIDTVQLTNQIIIQGQRATAVKGRLFLIINLKLINDTDKSLFLNTRNYVRVQPQGSSDKLAPEIHNDTVEVQPLSTKLTRIGLPVNDYENKFTLFVGELDGNKEQIEVLFDK